MSNYGNESIKKRTDREAVRQNPATYAGSTDINGAFTTVREIISNAIDEFKSGNGDVINVRVDENDKISVYDRGRGVPMDWNKGEEEFNYELIFCQLNAGGKYSKEDDDTGYDYAIGLNGIGSALTILSSETAKVTSVRDGKVYIMNFEKGEPVGNLEILDTKKDSETGTLVEWIPSLEVFDENKFEKDWFVSYFQY